MSSGVQASQSFKTPQKVAPGEDGDGRPAWPQRSSPWKGTPAKQMRVSPLTSWNRSPAYSALEEGMSGRQTPMLDVSPSRFVFWTNWECVGCDIGRWVTVWYRLEPVITVELQCEGRWPQCVVKGVLWNDLD